MALAAISGGATFRTSVATLDGPDPRAAAQRATNTYGGTFKRVGPGTRIEIKATVRHGEARRITSLDYFGPLNCAQSGQAEGGVRWFFRGVGVNAKRKFAVRGRSVDTPPSTLSFKGRFSRDFDKLRGTFKTRQWFPKDKGLPAEYCSMPRRRYGAKR